MGVFSDVYSGRNDFDFPRTWKAVGVVASVAVVVSIVLLVTRGLNLSIDFEGGSVWEVPSKTLTIEEAQKVTSDIGPGVGDKFQEATTTEGVRVVRVSGRVDSIAESQEVARKLADAAGIDHTEVAATTVGPSWGKDITRTARNSLVIFFVLVAAYIAWRLEPKMAFSGIVGVLHDILITLGIYSLFRIEVSPATMIAFLTILGYSLYDTIVIDDRIIDNVAKYGRTGRYTYTTITRRSLNEVLVRSMTTTFSTLIPVASMFVLGNLIFGERTLGDFSLALLIGLFLGAYSSLFVATPLTAVLKEREERWKEVHERIAARGLDPSDSSWATHGADAPTSTTSSPRVGSGSGGTSVPQRPAASGSSAPPLTTTIGGHPPRPRKKRR